jgi:hypothetical protein
VVGDSMDGSQPDSAVRENGPPSDHDGMGCALQVAKMVEPGPFRAGAYRIWKRLSASSSASVLGVVILASVGCDRSNLDNGPLVTFKLVL